MVSIIFSKSCLIKCYTVFVENKFVILGFYKATYRPLKGPIGWWGPTGGVSAPVCRKTNDNLMNERRLRDPVPTYTLVLRQFLGRREIVDF